MRGTRSRAVVEGVRSGTTEREGVALVDEVGAGRRGRVRVMLVRFLF